MHYVLKAAYNNTVRNKSYIEIKNFDASRH